LISQLADATLIAKSYTPRKYIYIEIDVSHAPNQLFFSRYVTRLCIRPFIEK
jgi:hypothetical protein